MTTAPSAGWERHEDGTHIAIPIPPAKVDEVRAWCAEHCAGDYMIVLGRRVVFQSREDAALATLWWRCEGG
ncbi:hypothetical protein GCM10009416_14330 [Craurococcus roseus]|uniref:Uncharacterized protein n=1 Tax=Craurococcus roseus TaxID=77585 RepID=A0ABP3Q0N7_9PROT